MSSETHHVERKSLRVVTGRTAAWSDLAADSVCFANATGGEIHIGIEDGENEPPAAQRVDRALLDLLRRRIAELTVNVEALPEVRTAANGGELIALRVPRSAAVASTTDGRYYARVGDVCRPVTGDEVMRLATDRQSIAWESITALGVSRTAVDGAKLAAWLAAIRQSSRVKPSVKEKPDAELIDHYGLAQGRTLTNLGILLLGTAADRRQLGTAPIVQAIRYDERGVKVWKTAWDDHQLSPLELVEAVWAAVPDFRESYEIPEGMWRAPVPAFDPAVVRELLVNALVHRPYTQGGDLYLNLHPDRLEIVNPGRLPFGVTPRNILHQSRRRNEGLARVFHDLELMEREGTGIDLVYERLLASGRAAPQVSEGTDSVHVVIPRRVIQPTVIRLLADADERYQLGQRERIVLGLLAQTEGLTVEQLAARLELDEEERLRDWLGRLLDVGLVQRKGRTRATRYFIPPELLRTAGLDRRTTLSRVEPHRLRALVLEDLDRYPDSSRTDVHRRIGQEIHAKAVARTLQRLVEEGAVQARGVKRWRKYRLADSHGQSP